MRRAMKLHVLAAACAALASATVLAASGNAEAGSKKSQPCQACHGQNGMSVSPDFPNLAGQNADYLFHALKHYKNGKRKNPIMAAQVEKLTNKDMMDLAAYFASQKALSVKH